MNQERRLTILAALRGSGLLLLFMALVAVTVPEAVAEAQQSDINLHAGADSVLATAEGSSLQFDLFFREPTPVDLVVSLELNFASPNNADSASFRDLDNTNGHIVRSPAGDRFFIEVPVAVGTSSLPVIIHTAADGISPEGELALERFRVSIAKVEGVNGNPSFGGPIELTIEDVAPPPPTVTPEPAPTSTPAPTVTPAPTAGPVPTATPTPGPTATPGRTGRYRPNRTRSITLVIPEITPDPVQGPLVSGAATWSVDGRLVTVELPASLRVWLAPRGAVQLVRGVSPVASERGTPSTLSFTIPDDAKPPIIIDLRGRLRGGAVYSEQIVIDR